MKPGDLVWLQEFERDKVIKTPAILLDEILDDKWATSRVFLTDTGEIINVSIIWLKQII
jgi:hypothetical protein